MCATPQRSRCTRTSFCSPGTLIVPRITATAALARCSRLAGVLCGDACAAAKDAQTTSTAADVMILFMPGSLDFPRRRKMALAASFPWKRGELILLRARMHGFAAASRTAAVFRGVHANAKNSVRLSLYFVAY